MWPMGLLFMIFDMSSCSTFNFGVFLHLHFIHDTWDYHREAICHVITIQLTFDLKVKFIWFLTWLGIGATAFFSFDKVIPDLAHHHRMMAHMHS